MVKKEKESESKIPQHKRMAEGEKITGMKSGGMCKKKGGKVVEKTKKKK